MAYIVMARRLMCSGLYSYGLFSYGLFSYGLYSYGTTPYVFWAGVRTVTSQLQWRGYVLTLSFEGLDATGDTAKYEFFFGG